ALTDPLGLSPSFPQCFPSETGPTVCLNFDNGAGVFKWPCFGFIGYWHAGCPQRPNPPPQTDEEKKERERPRKQQLYNICVAKAQRAADLRENPIVGDIMKPVRRDMIWGAVIGCLSTIEAGCIPGAAAGAGLAAFQDIANGFWDNRKKIAASR